MTAPPYKDSRLSRLWPWIEQRRLRRFVFAMLLGIAAALLHWAILPLTQGRITFIFFVPAIVLATTIAGRWPGVLVAVMGLVNSGLMKAPGTLMIPYSAEQVSLIIMAVVSVMVILVGGYYRSLSQRELNDLNDLHELSTALSTLAGLTNQLALILRTFARMHHAPRGLVTVYDPERGDSAVAASVGLDNSWLERLPLAERSRVVVEDTAHDPRFAQSRDLATKEGIRSMHSTPLLSRDGELLGALTVLLPDPHRVSAREIRLADICARKAAVFIERARAEERVSQRDRRFEAVLQSAGVPFVVFSPVRRPDGTIADFRFTFLNPAAARVMRATPADFVGRCVTEVLPRAWDDRERFEMYVRAIEQQKVLEMERHSEADENRAWYHIIASPLDGDLAVWFADISQRKQQERDLIEAARRKDEFLATLAHELRNPLAPIRQAAGIARSDHASETQKRWSSSVIERQVQHMSLLLDDLLDVSRITHGTLQLRRQRSDLKSVVGAAIETARPLIDERRHGLRVDVPDDLHVNADPLRLAQVLSNLLTNAAKYTHPEGSIRVAANRQGEEIIIDVEDNGIGIDAHDLPKVFGMFAQLNAAHEHSAGGLGIGLALARGIVELHGGRVEAASEGVGRGSRFTVRLPAASSSSPVTDSPGSGHNGHSMTHRRILLADDNRDAAETLAILLRLEGHEVILAHDGRAALQVFTERRPDVALLDIGMPELDGYEVARHIRATPGGTGVLLVAVTGWAQDSDKASAHESGFDLHLTKPVDPEALIGLLGDVAPPKGS